MTVPSPSQGGQGADDWTWPKMERCTVVTKPVPWQRGQSFSCAPGAMPEPEQSSQGARRVVAYGLGAAERGLLERDGHRDRHVAPLRRRERPRDPRAPPPP